MCGDEIVMRTETSVGDKLAGVSSYIGSSPNGGTIADLNDVRGSRTDCRADESS